MRRLTVLLAAGGLAAPALAAEPAFTPQAANEAALEENGGWRDGQSALVLRVQVLLDRAGVSPGVIDGYLGENVRKALAAYEEIEGFPVDGELDPEVFAALSEGDPAPVLGAYTITEDDVDGPFVESIPDDYAALAEMERLSYRGPRELLAETFHMDQDLLAALNPDADFDVAGTQIVVAQTGDPIERAAIARIEVARSIGAVRALDADGALIIHYPATIGSEETPSPSGTHEIVAVAPDPVYYYRPEVNFQQGGNERQLEIPPGPNNPVGSTWIDLSEPTYGIHGTPEPALIDKTYSHGCVRLTNWDADELAGLVEQGLTVAFVE
jgi:lipoprotein-anchoring transpeptidase ErfK/SrfK